MNSSSRLAVLSYIIFLSSNLKPCSSSTKTYTYWTIETTANVSFPCGVDHAYAAGVDSSGVIWLGEGVECHDDYIFSYTPSTQLFTSTGCPSSCPVTLIPVAQYYTQIDDILYKTDGRKFIYYDLILQSGWTNLQYPTTSTNVKFPINMEADSQCITSTPNGKLVGVGGIQDESPSAAVFLYDLSGADWYKANDLPFGRYSAACIVHPYDSNLYVMGGSIEIRPSYTNTFHKLPYGGDYQFIGDYSWETYSNSVLSEDHFGRLVGYNNWLIALGGYTDTFSGYIIAWDTSSPGEPKVIDSTSGMTGFQWGNAAHALVGNTIYVFGDNLRSDLLNWQTITLTSATPEPTHHPTKQPTNGPTQATNEPTNPPSNQPTKGPMQTPRPTKWRTPKWARDDSGDLCCGCMHHHSYFGCRDDKKCEKTICDSDEYCCAKGWDYACSSQAKAICEGDKVPTCCGKCTIARKKGKTGCKSDKKCERKVCGDDPFCCGEYGSDKGYWDENCAKKALYICAK